MGLLQTKHQKTAIVGVRVPVSLKDLLSDLRTEADAAGFDLTATLTEALVRAAKQISTELNERRQHAKPMPSQVSGGSNESGAMSNGKES